MTKTHINLFTNYKALLLSLALCLLFSCRTGTPKLICHQLSLIEQTIDNNPKKALEALQQMANQHLSKKNKALYALLYTMAQDKSDTSFSNDSLISTAVDWFSRTTQYSRYANSLLYNGIVRYHLNPLDTVAYHLLKQAEETLISHNIEDSHLEDLLYAYLCVINQYNEDFRTSLLYAQKEMDAAKRDGNSRNYIMSLSHVFFSHLALKDTLACEAVIDELQAIKEIPEEDISLYTEINYLCSSNLSPNTQTFKDIISKLLNNPFAKDSSRCFFLASTYYDKLNIVDSALFYGKLSVSKDNNESINYFHYHNNLANLYSKKGDYFNATLHYKKALKLFITNYHLLSEKRVTELERQYETAYIRQETERVKNKAQWFGFGAIVCFLIITIVLLRNYYHRKFAEEQAHRYSFIVNVINDTIGVFPDFVNKVNAISFQYKAVDEKAFDDLQRAITAAKKNSRSVISLVANNPSFTSLYQNNMPKGLSDREKMILLFTDSGLTTEAIAHVLNISQSSVRAGRTAIKKKKSPI